MEKRERPVVQMGGLAPGVSDSPGHILWVGGATQPVLGRSGDHWMASSGAEGTESPASKCSRGLRADPAFTKRLLPTSMPVGVWAAGKWKGVRR